MKGISKFLPECGGFSDEVRFSISLFSVFAAEFFKLPHCMKHLQRIGRRREETEFGQKN